MDLLFNHQHGLYRESKEPYTKQNGEDYYP